MPSWILALQALAPLIKWGIDQIVNHKPAADESQVHQDARANVLASLQAVDKCIGDACQAHTLE